jgi:hydroxypyruvate isomerase
MMLDVYHAQIGEGNLIELLLQAAGFIGDVQVADVTGRGEPGTEEIRTAFSTPCLSPDEISRSVG